MRCCDNLRLIGSRMLAGSLTAEQARTIGYQLEVLSTRVEAKEDAADYAVEMAADAERALHEAQLAQKARERAIRDGVVVPLMRASR